VIRFKLKYRSEQAKHQQNFFFPEEIDQIIFLNTFIVIKKKTLNHIKINLSEVIWLYCGYISNGILSGKEITELQNDLTDLINEEMVMIGVRESITSLEIMFWNNEGKSFNFFIQNPISKKKIK